MLNYEFFSIISFIQIMLFHPILFFFVIVTKQIIIKLVESFLCPDKQVTPEESRSTQRPKRCEKNNKDEDNSPKTLPDKNIIKL